ncbi:hypothetical protein TGME49_310885 [Toxoplasma gondii ME49]|uniref:Uncharacterized protein n=2 Tax=Toxoplasma gondii TaxID=5811 RepID=A0A125YIL7_TOXGV|nr:hypothetical protein TGME49_310885 [Toxoplasma gondii ME49]EPT26141.1 hypothetical protein TGME49_310885 [Toxoplasma gondii ME49]ESS34937.1 hypothetical protein TGVEG_310885 [Toxoplasma gondii VEG]|eukprot:XP_018635546.1 hypothetical protein TGME49_310885 [Toxoplasma gondii ME49]
MTCQDSTAAESPECFLRSPELCPKMHATVFASAKTVKSFRSTSNQCWIMALCVCRRLTSFLFEKRDTREEIHASKPKPLLGVGDPVTPVDRQQRQDIRKRAFPWMRGLWFVGGSERAKSDAPYSAVEESRPWKIRFNLLFRVTPQKTFPTRPVYFWLRQDSSPQTTRVMQLLLNRFKRCSLFFHSEEPAAVSVKVFSPDNPDTRVPFSSK